MKEILVFILVSIFIGTLIIIGAVCVYDEIKTPGSRTDDTIPVVASSKNITVSYPKPNGTIGEIFKVAGRARVFENQLNIRIVASGKNIYETGVMAMAEDVGQFGGFEKEINLYNLGLEESQNIFLEVFDYSAKDGSEIDKVSVPLKFVPSGEAVTEVTVYFGSKEDPDQSFSCTNLFPIERVVPKTEGVARAALEELLKGPTVAERDQGYFTNVNIGVKINNLTIENGTARVDFDDQLEYQVGGSCRVAAIRAQITRTLTQFSTVKSVVISINGRTEDILQP